MNLSTEKSYKLKLYFLLFTISGFSGLIYESIWTHYLKLFLGHSAYSQTLVLIIFMGGMAIGAYFSGKYSTRIKNLLIAYAIIECVIGIFGVFFHTAFISTTNFTFFSIIPLFSSLLAIDLFKWSIAAILILPQSILLGSTFPIISSGIIRLYPKSPGHSIALLYFFNSLGASIGILVSGFFLIELFGLPGTILLAAIINIILAVVFWLLSRKQNPSIIPLDNIETNELKNKTSKLLIYIFFLAAGLTGTASFMYEIGWIRMLSIVLGSTSHAFELIVSTFILGLAIGSYLIKRRIDLLKNPIKTLGIIQICMGFFAMLSLVTYGKSFDFMIYIIKGLTKTDQGFGLYNVLSHGICMFMMLPASICAGMTLPLLTYILVKKGLGEASIGKVYAANTLGSILGVILAIQFIMPVFGLKNLIIFAASIDVFLGIILLKIYFSKIKTTKWILTSAIIIFIFFTGSIFIKLNQAKLSSQVYRKPTINKYIKKIFQKDGKTASVVMKQYQNGFLSLSSNGRTEAILNPSDPNEFNSFNIMAASLPLAYHTNIKKVATIGLGGGFTTNILLYDPNIKQLDIIEIEEAMVEGAKKFGNAVFNTFNDPRSRIHVEDAKTFFVNRKNKYDVIISFPSCPWVSGVSGLFSVEFYGMVKRYLLNKGIFVQWITLLESNTDLVASIIKAISVNFKDYLIYFADDFNMILIASNETLNADPSKRIFTIPELKKSLNSIGIENLQDLQLRKLGYRKTLDPMFQSFSIRANSDYFPVLEIGSTKALFLNTESRELFTLKSNPLPLIETLEGSKSKIQSNYSSHPKYLSIGQQAASAMDILNYFKSVKNKKVRNTVKKPEILHLVEKIRSIHWWPKHTNLKKDWLHNLHKFAKATLPYLSPEEMDFIWTDLESAVSLKNDSNFIKIWFNLYQAISRRDFKKMLAYSKILLPVGNINKNLKNDLLLQTAILSCIVKKKYIEGIKLWDRYNSKSNPSLSFRLLLGVLSKKVSPFIKKK